MTHDESVQKEIYYIEKYHSYINSPDANGYNMTLGGEGVKKLTSNDRDFLIQKYYEIRSTKKMAKLLSQYNDGSSSYIGRLLNSYGIPIYELNLQQHKRKIAKVDIETNEILEVFDSIRDANTSLGKPLDSSNIRTCLSGKTKSAYGYKWIDYVDELFRRFQHWIFYSSSKKLIWI